MCTDGRRSDAATRGVELAERRTAARSSRPSRSPRSREKLPDAAHEATGLPAEPRVPAHRDRARSPREHRTFTRSKRLRGANPPSRAISADRPDPARGLNRDAAYGRRCPPGAASNPSTLATKSPRHAARTLDAGATSILRAGRKLTARRTTHPRHANRYPGGSSDVRQSPRACRRSRLATKGRTAAIAALRTFSGRLGRSKRGLLSPSPAAGRAGRFSFHGLSNGADPLRLAPPRSIGRRLPVIASIKRRAVELASVVRREACTDLARLGDKLRDARRIGRLQRRRGFRLDCIVRLAFRSGFGRTPSRLRRNERRQRARHVQQRPAIDRKGSSSRAPISACTTSRMRERAASGDRNVSISSSEASIADRGRARSAPKAPTADRHSRQP